MASSGETGSSLTTVGVMLRNDPVNRKRADLKVTTLSRAGRLVLALRYLGISWLIALLCVLVPVLHFFLVPLGLFAGIVLFVRKYSLRHFMEKGQVACPKCGAGILLEANAFNWPRREFCTQCRNEIVITGQ